MALQIRRREFIVALAGAVAARPLAARAQQPAMPVIGFLEIRSPETIIERLRAFRQGLKETGYVEGENIAMDYRWAEQTERLPDLAAQLVRRQVAVIVTAGTTALAAKDATTTIPIVFASSGAQDRRTFRSFKQPSSNSSSICRHVGSVLFVIAVASISYSDIKKEFDGYKTFKITAPDGQTFEFKAPNEETMRRAVDKLKEGFVPGKPLTQDDLGVTRDDPHRDPVAREVDRWHAVPGCERNDEITIDHGRG